MSALLKIVVVVVVVFFFLSWTNFQVRQNRDVVNMGSNPKYVPKYGYSKFQTLSNKDLLFVTGLFVGSLRNKPVSKLQSNLP